MVAIAIAVAAENVTGTVTNDPTRDIFFHRQPPPCRHFLKTEHGSVALLTADVRLAASFLLSRRVLKSELPSLIVVEADFRRWVGSHTVQNICNPSVLGSYAVASPL